MSRALELVAAAIRFLAALVVGLFVFTVAAMVVHRVMAREEVREPARDALLVHTEYDRRVLAVLTRRALESPPASLDPEDLWAQRPALVGVTSTIAAPVYFRERALDFIRWDSGSFAYARRGVIDALPILLGAIVIILGFAAAAAVARAPEAVGRIGILGGLFTLLLVITPLAFVSRVDLFHDRTAELGGPVMQALFVAAFVAAAARMAAGRSGPVSPSVRFMSEVQGSPRFGLAAREAVLDAIPPLRALVPTLAVAAVFVRAKAELSVASVDKNGLALLIVRTVRAESRHEQWVNGIILTLAMVLLTVLGEAFVTETRRVFAPPAGRNLPGDAPS